VTLRDLGISTCIKSVNILKNDHMDVKKRKESFSAILEAALHILHRAGNVSINLTHHLNFYTFKCAYRLEFPVIRSSPPWMSQLHRAETEEGDHKAEAAVCIPCANMLLI